MSESNIREFKNALRRYQKLCGKSLQNSAQAHSKPGWWVIAEKQLRPNGVSPALLVYIAMEYVNEDADDVQVPRSGNIFRSEVLMLRALNNFRNFLKAILRPYRPFYKALTGRGWMEDFETANLGALAHRVVSCHYRYFHMAIPVSLARRLDRNPTPAEVSLELYRQCRRNPFMIAGLTKHPRIDAIVLSNMMIQTHQMPWNKDLWEGVAFDGCSLTDVGALDPGENIGKYFPTRLYETWPEDPIKDPLEPLEDFENPGPKLWLSCPVHEGALDNHLEMRLHHGASEEE